MIPTNWPNNITYSNIQSFMGFKNLRKDFIPGVKIEKINDPNSILYNQFGLFSTIEFDKFDIIGQYTGKLVNEFQGGVYVASSNKCCIDAINIGNELRFINDVMTVFSLTNFLPKIISLISTESSALSGAVTEPIYGLSESVICAKSMSKCLLFTGISVGSQRVPPEW